VLHAVILLPMIALGFVFLWLENVSLTKITPQEKSAQDVEHAPGKRGEE
jgi:hypothetical protein